MSHGGGGGGGEEERGGGKVGGRWGEEEGRREGRRTGGGERGESHVTHSMNHGTTVPWGEFHFVTAYPLLR